MELKEQLQGIGLLKNEARVYLALIELGQTTTEPIKKKTGITAAKVYETLYRLMGRGLVKFSVINKKKHFQAVDPERLLDIIHEEQKKIDAKRIRTKDLIQALNRLQKQEKDRIVWMYKGLEGAKTAILDTFKHIRSGDEVLVMGVRKGFEDFTLDEKLVTRIIDNYVKTLNKNKISERVICNSDVRQKMVKRFGKIKTTKMRFLDQNTPATIRIYGNRVSVTDFATKPENVTIYEIESPNVAKSFREFFETMWVLAKE